MSQIFRRRMILGLSSGGLEFSTEGLQHPAWGFGVLGLKRFRVSGCRVQEFELRVPDSGSWDWNL